MDGVDVCHIWARMASSSWYGDMVSKQGLGTKQLRKSKCRRRFSVLKESRELSYPTKGAPMHTKRNFWVRKVIKVFIRSPLIHHIQVRYWYITRRTVCIQPIPFLYLATIGTLHNSLHIKCRTNAIEMKFMTTF